MVVASLGAGVAAEALGALLEVAHDAEGFGGSEAARRRGRQLVFPANQQVPCGRVAARLLARLGLAAPRRACVHTDVPIRLPSASTLFEKTSCICGTSSLQGTKL